MTYKQYEALVTFDEDAELFHGEVINTRDVITFQGHSVRELKKAFADSVEDYLDFCHARGEQPDKPFSGRLALRIQPNLHRDLALEARLAGKSLNALIAEKLEKSVATPPPR